MYVKWKTRVPACIKSLYSFPFFHFTNREKKMYESLNIHYAYLVESYRNKEGKVKQRIIAYLGTSEKPRALSQRVNSVLDSFPGLSKRNRIKILRAITKRSRFLTIEGDKLVCTKPSEKEMTREELAASILENFKIKMEISPIIFDE